MNIYSIVSLLLLVLIDKIHKGRLFIHNKMSSFKEQASALLFSVISLETLMSYYNSFMASYTSLQNKLQQSASALSPIWWSTDEPHYYTSDLNSVSWIHSPHRHLLWSSAQPDGVETKLETIPWLSAELYYGETKLADISHWIMELHYRGWPGCVPPTVDVILQAWAATHGHRIHYADLAAYRFVVIDDMGEDKEYKIGQRIIG
jgi:hypothetical protein